MSIETECSECGKQYRFSDDRAGRTTRCKDCGADIEIPSKRRKSGSKKRKSSSLGPGVLIGGVVAGVAALVGLLAVLFLRQPAAPPANPIPANNAPGIANAPANAPLNVPAPAVAQNSAVPQATTPTTPAVPAVTNPATPVVPNLPAGVPQPAVPTTPSVTPPSATPPAAPGFQKPAFAAFFKPVANWKAQVDPPAEKFTFELSKKFQIKTVEGYLSDEHILFSETPSRLALIGSDNQSRTVWNLATGEKGNILKGPRISGRTIGFSPDGQYVAWYRFENGGGIEVYDLPAKKSLGTLALEAKKFNVASIAMPTPTRLVAVSDVNHGIMTWKLPSGESDRSINLGDRARPGDRRAFSPGGRLLAVLGDAIKRSITLIDLDTGDTVGEIEPAQGSSIVLLGMAFSHDGREFAAAFMDSLGREAERIAIWNVADGVISAEFQLPNPDERKLEVVSRQQSLQWFPDGQRLLLNGRYVIDRTAKNVVYAFAKPTLDVDTLRTRRILSDTTIASWEGTKQSAVLAPLELNADELARAKEIAAAGGLLVDAKLPKLTLLDRSKAADRSAIAAGWRATADPGSAPASSASKIPLKGAEGLIREIVVSRPDAKLVGLRYTDEEESMQTGVSRVNPQSQTVTGTNRTRARVRFAPTACRTNWIELHDASQREPVRRLALDFPCELMSISPDGSRVLVQAINGEGRLDVYSADGQHIAGCRPFQDEAEADKRAIVSAEFLDANTVAACSVNDHLIVFRVPSCEPVYAVEDAGTLAISPGGKMIATSAQQKIDFRDALTGEGLGSVRVEDNFASIAFSPAGDRLAVLTLNHKETAVLLIDVASGSTTSVPIPPATLPLVWTGDNHVLVGSPKLNQRPPAKGIVGLDRTLMLVDLTFKAVVWSYVTNVPDNVALAMKPYDGRLWWAGPSGNTGDRQLVAEKLPEPTVLKRLDGKSLNAQALVRPGSSVDLQVAVTEPAEIADFAKKAQASIDNSVKANELTVKSGEATRLVVSIAPAAASGTFTIETFGLGAGTGKREQVTVQKKAVTVRIAYETSGKTIWESKNDLTNSFFGFTRLPQGKSVQTALDESMWEQALTTLRQNFPPAYIFKSETALGLGSSRLTGKGATLEGK